MIKYKRSNKYAQRKVSSMINSIKYFEEKSIPVFEKLEGNFYRNPTDVATFVTGLTEELHQIGIHMIKETLENMNLMLKESGKRVQGWMVEKDVEKQLLTSLGMVQYTKTLFTNKETGEMEFLLDRIMGLKKHERMTEDAEAKLLTEAVQTSYRRGGENASILDSVSKQTVKNKIHQLRFPKATPPIQKKEVDYLYIDADEDHVSLQFREKKGDLTVAENGYKNNCQIAKLVYIYEGVEPENPKSKRNKLISPYYFGRVCEGQGNEELWDEIWEYINATYDMEKVKKIYLNSDGGAWIDAGKKRLHKVTGVLDEFHMQKYMIKMTSNPKLLDSGWDARHRLYGALKNGTKEDFMYWVNKIDEYEEVESGHKRVWDAANYILSNWTAARTRVQKRDAVCGCSAEGHVSHVLSSRMSSRPMGWSKTGVAKMSELRAYYYNKKDMLELVRYQKEALPKVAGMEYPELSLKQILDDEKKQRSELGKYMECISHSVSLSTKKKAWFQAHIWGL